MISDAERNYRPKTWRQIDGLPPYVEPLTPFELSLFCNTDSQRFKDLNLMGRGGSAVLLDYELLSLDLDPLCGSAIYRKPPAPNKLYLIVFTANGPRYFKEV